MKNLRAILGCLLVIILAAGCVTQKKKGNEEVGWLKKRYHNLTSKYNYWFNANELYNLTVIKLEGQHKDNYSRLLEIYPATAVDPMGVRGDLDNVIKKSSMAIGLHRPSDWCDDSYTLIGEAQFLKRDFETAENTFRYVRDEYDPKKPKFKKSSKKKKKATVKKKKKASAKKKKKAAKKRKKEREKKKKEAAKAGKLKKGSPQPNPAPAPEKPVEVPVQTATAANPYDKGMGRTAAFPRAMIDFGRTLTAREKYEEAEFLFRDLWDDPFFPKEQFDELAMAEADLYIKRKNYDQAIPPLVKAIENTSKKARRARLSYILAQLYDKTNQHQQAAEAFAKVLDNNPPYELEINARLNQIRSAWAQKQLPTADANRALERLAKESKNAEYRDQIYFTMAMIALEEGLKKDAVALLLQSLANSKNNTPQRAESYLALADLYFESEDFVSAKNYYDSTLTVLVNTDTRYQRVSDYANNLKDIARLIQTVAANDSLLRIYQMNPEQKREFALGLKKKRDEEAAKRAVKDAIASQPKSTASPTPQAGGITSNFYFYNESFLKKGRRDFGKDWGGRTLEDNWRRSSRPQTGLAGNDNTSGSDSLAKSAELDSDLQSLLQGIPSNPGELAVLHASNYDAMFQLGKLYRERLQHHRRSTGILEEVQQRYPDTVKFEKDIWYYAYLGFKDLSNEPRAKYYYDKLVEKYPNSAYARALSDPNFLNATKERERDLNEYYQNTFVMFQQGQYQSVFDRCQEAPKKYGSTNPLMAKFSLLGALAIGNIQGNEAYCKALNDMIGQFPESAEATRAKEIARVLQCKGFEGPDPMAKKTDASNTIAEAFNMEPEKLHFVLVLITDDDAQLDDVKVAISNYNRENHRNEQLRISNVYIGSSTENPVVVIRKFDNQSLAMNYITEVKKQKKFLDEDGKGVEHEIFAITQENYRRVLKNKSIDGYREFYNANYK